MPAQASPRPTRLLFAAAALLGVAAFALRYPGEISFDAAKQLEQAMSGRYDDWHPPIMAALWSVLSRLAPAGPAMLAFQLSLHWLGVALVADGLARTGRSRAAWVMLASGASPLFLYYGGIIYKDVGLASTFLAAYGLVYWFRAQERRLPAPAVLAVVALLAYGTLVRANAVFAFGPLLLFLLARPAGLATGRMLAGSMALAVLAVPVSAVINHDLFRARVSGVQQTLQLFDLAGIARYSGDLSVLPDAARMSADDLRHCYSPLYWDTLRLGVCHRAFDRLPPPSPERDALAHRWLSAIVRHPLAYADHRVRTFNALLNFVVPAQQCRFAPFDASCGTPDPRTGRMMMTSDAASFIRHDYLKKPFPVWPVTWLALGLCLFALSTRPSTIASRMSRPLLASGLLYALAYLVVGVAGDIRYVYWPMVAFQTALIVGWNDIWPRARRRDPVVLLCLGVMLATVAVGYLARLTDNASLVS